VMNQLGSVGERQAIMTVFHRVLRVSPLSDVPMLITGETGTGKEFLAHAIHQLDIKRCHGPFIGFCREFSSTAHLGYGLPLQSTDRQERGSVMVSFMGAYSAKDIILTCVRWYVAYPLSYRQVEELTQERGVSVDHATINRWVLKYSPQLEAAFHRRKRPVWRSWRMARRISKYAGTGVTCIAPSIRRVKPSTSRSGRSATSGRLGASPPRPSAAAWAGRSPVSPWSTQATSTASPVTACTRAANRTTDARSCAWAAVTCKARRCPRVSTAMYTLLPRFCFGPIIAGPGAALRRGLQRAAVQDRRRRRLCAAYGQPQDEAQVMHHGLERASTQPALGLLLYRLPRWQVVGYHPPRRTRPCKPA
jgi:hypothetical protein